MTNLTRREWLALSAAALLQAGSAAAQRDRRWGVQLYTVRGLMAKDAAVTLERIAALGYTELEVLQPTLDTVAPIAKRLGLTIVSAHLTVPTPAGPALASFIDAAKAHGLKYLVMPYVRPDDRPGDRAGYLQMAQGLARLSDQVRKAGLDLCYHNHAFEFATDADGTRWLDLLMRETAASQMKLELDVFWASIAGADPVALIKQYSGRVALIHLKDKKPGSPVMLTESVPRDAFVEVGSGALDFPAILAAARASGAAHYFVEQDATPGDPVDSLQTSFRYLSQLR